MLEASFAQASLDQSLLGSAALSVSHLLSQDTPADDEPRMHSSPPPVMIKFHKPATNSMTDYMAERRKYLLAAKGMKQEDIPDGHPHKRVAAAKRMSY